MMGEKASGCVLISPSNSLPAEWEKCPPVENGTAVLMSGIEQDNISPMAVSLEHGCTLLCSSLSFNCGMFLFALSRCKVWKLRSVCRDSGGLFIALDGHDDENLLITRGDVCPTHSSFPKCLVFCCHIKVIIKVQQKLLLLLRCCTATDESVARWVAGAVNSRTPNASLHLVQSPTFTIQATYHVYVRSNVKRTIRYSNRVQPL